jgi:hypothetical protein
MNLDAKRPEAPASTHLHPAIYRSMLWLVLLLIAASWGFFIHGAYAGLALAVVSGFLLIAVAIPWRLRRIARLHHGPNLRRRDPGSVSRWLARDFETWQYRLRGRDAAIMILLPIVAVAVGMTLFAIEYAIVTA